MINRNALIGLAVVLALVVCIARPSREPLGAQEKAASVVRKWEYKVVLPDNPVDPLANQPQLVRLGAEGWELCAAHSSTRPAYFIFKRPGR